MKIRNSIKKHVSDNRWQYFLILIIFLTGLILGNYRVLSLEGGVKSHLLTLIDDYLRGGIEGTLDGQSIFFSAFLYQAKSVFAVWFLGLTVIGLPLILAVVFLRGFALGFTVGFLLQEKAGAGIMITAMSILPQNIVYIPFLIIWAVIAINFSVFIVKGKKSEFFSLGRAFIVYSIWMLIFMSIFLAGAFIEAYLSPWFLSLIL